MNLQNITDVVLPKAAMSKKIYNFVYVCCAVVVSYVYELNVSYHNVVARLTASLAMVIRIALTSKFRIIKLLFFSFQLHTSAIQ